MSEKSPDRSDLGFELQEGFLKVPYGNLLADESKKFTLLDEKGTRLAYFFVHERQLFVWVYSISELYRMRLAHILPSGKTKNGLSFHLVPDQNTRAPHLENAELHVMSKDDFSVELSQKTPEDVSNAEAFSDHVNANKLSEVINDARTAIFPRKD